MKFVLGTVALLAALCMVRAEESNPNYTAVFSSIEHIGNDLLTFTNQQLEKSYDFLLLSFAFDKHDMDRPGFEKLYRKISDKAWEDTEKLIKYQSRRGLAVNLGAVQGTVLSKVNKTPGKDWLLKSTEMSSLQVALGYEKTLGNEAHKMHKKISHAHATADNYDPDVAHFLDEEIVEYQSGTVRKLSGYIHNLNSITSEPNTEALGIHLFDEYLDKVE